MSRIIYVLIEMDYGGDFFVKGVTRSLTIAERWAKGVCRHYEEFEEELV